MSDNKAKKIPIGNGSKRLYEGASKSKKFSQWVTPSTSAQAEVEMGNRVIRDRVRALVRNDSLTARAVSVIETNVVGKGIRPQFRIKDGGLKQKIEELWSFWAEKKDIDFHSKKTFYGIQTLAVRSMVESGECLIIKRFDRNGNLKLQVIEADHLDETKDTIIRNQTGVLGDRIRQGIEFDGQGRVVAYHIYDYHPGDSDSINIQSKKYSASDVIHLFRVDRPGQIRGISWGAPAIIKSRHLSDYEFAELERQRIATCFTAFIKKAAIDDQTEEEDEHQLETITPGMIERLGFDEDIVFSNPPQPTDINGSFRFAMERRIAMAWGVPVDAVSGDLSRVNFSSGRMGRLDFYRNVDSWQQGIVVPCLNDTVMEWWLDSLVLKGSINKSQRDSIRYSWVVPERAFIDPAKEFKAIDQQISTGVMSKSEAIRMRGKDPSEVMEQIALDKQKEIELGIYSDENHDAESIPLEDLDEDDLEDLEEDDGF